MQRRSFVRAIPTTLVIAVLTASQAWAGINPQPFRTGLFGIAAGQAIRVSLLNAGNQAGVINPCVYPPDPVMATVVVRNLLGGALFKADTEKLSAGMGTFVDVPPDPTATTSSRTGGLPASARRQLRVEAVVLLPVPDDDACQTEEVLRALRRQVQLTLEVYDVATGRTEFTMPFVAVAGVDPTPF
jgi:hypothetical protein